MDYQFDQTALEALYLMEKTSDNIFLTGKAWTGKSTLLRSFIQNSNKNIAVLAPTGVSALNIWGSTIHSFFKISPAVTEKTVKKEAFYSIGDPKFTELDAVVIDEISMVRADLFDCINIYMQTVCQNKFPFGWKQMIMIGDLFQLPPVVTFYEKQAFQDLYPSPYFFSAKIVRNWKFKFHYYQLQKVYRQDDQSFISILNEIRNKNLTSDSLLALHNQVILDPEREIAPWEMYLATRNDVVNQINADKLNALDSQEYVFQAKVKWNMKSSAYPTEESLYLKVWAQVMFMVNDPQLRRANGTLGTVVHIDKKSVLVQIFGWELVEVKSFTRELKNLSYNPDKRRLESEIVGWFSQIPLRLARACTIHKSQGKTFDKVIIDLRGWAFAHGQTYVALSRCKTLEGIRLVSPLQHSDILLDQAVIEFVQQFL